jgi:hypothetical protein
VPKLSIAVIRALSGRLKPGYKFEPIIRDAVLRDFDAKKLMHSAQKIVPIPTTNVIIIPSDPEKQSAPTQANISD